MRISIIRFFVYVIIISSVTASAQIPRSINFQGKLTDPDGIAIEGFTNINFVLYDSITAGIPLWNSGVTTVNCTKGLFDIILGPIPLNFDQPYWMELVVNGETLIPRQPLSAAPYAMYSLTANMADTAMAVEWSNIYALPPGFADGIDDTGSSTGGTGDTMIAHWDSIRNIPPDLADGDNSGLQKVKEESSPWLTDSVIFVEGTNVTLDQAGAFITVNSSGGSDNMGDCNTRGIAINDDGGDNVVNFSDPIDMSGNDIGDVNEITAVSIDPVYLINGELYRTWVPDMVGQKTECVGEAELNGDGLFVIDLAQQPRGSDLWLFWNAVALNTIIPFVTPQGPVNLYAKIEDSKFLVASLDGTGGIPFSYRLIGIRNDFRNMTPEQTNRRDKPASTYIDIDNNSEYSE
ncbi:hypothetical protein JW877_10255 [bacterium]|nr:hypothetical protein [bacterium]